MCLMHLAQPVRRSANVRWAVSVRHIRNISFLHILFACMSTRGEFHLSWLHKIARIPVENKEFRKNLIGYFRSSHLHASRKQGCWINPACSIFHPCRHLIEQCHTIKSVSMHTANCGERHFDAGKLLLDKCSFDVCCPLPSDAGIQTSDHSPLAQSIFYRLLQSVVPLSPACMQFITATVCSLPDTAVCRLPDCLSSIASHANSTSNER